MALSYAREGNIITVREIVYSATSTRIQYWYYDVMNWRKSSRGQQNDKLDRPMTAADIRWVKAYYLPKVEDQTCGPFDDMESYEN